MDRERNVSGGQQTPRRRAQVADNTKNSNHKQRSAAPVTMPTRSPKLTSASQPMARLATGQNSKPASVPKVERRPASGGNGSPSSAQVARAAQMKKAFVRFDDYLDLNEENMRRSCKRLMNHLYSETSSSQVVVAPAPISDQAPNKCPATPTASAAGAPNNINNSNSNESAFEAAAVAVGNQTFGASANGGKCISIADINNKKSFGQPSPSNQTQTQTQAATATSIANTNGKSYLRSQYERRQQRQLELMSKMQLEPAGTNIADGASARRLQQLQVHQQQQKHVQEKQVKRQEEQRRRQMHQQDLVAKSHELSKRRFFEKLERRESIKNLNLRSTLNERPITPAATNEANPALLVTLPPPPPQQKTTQNSQITDTEIRITGGKQKSRNENELMLKAYQSIVLKGKSANSDTASKLDDVDNLTGMDTPDSSGGAVNCGAKELAVELIGFCTPCPSPQPPADSSKRAEELIKFSVREQQEQVDGKFSSKLVVQHQQQVEQRHHLESTVLASAIASHKDESAFEISVPPNNGSSDSLNQPDGFISSGLLLVKQVQVDSSVAETRSMIESPTPKLLPAGSSADAALAIDGPPTLSGHQISEVSTQRAMANKKAKAPLDADDSTDNKVDQIDGQAPKNVSRTMESVSKTSDDGIAASKVTFSAAESHLPAIGDDNRQNQTASISLTISSGNNHNSNNNSVVSAATALLDEATGNEFDAGSSSNSGRGSNNKLEIDSASEREAIEVGGGSVGESNRVKDHEAPETRMTLIEQPGTAAAALNPSKIPTLVGSNSAAYPVQIESAAQKQQLALLAAPANSQTITKPEIRDVLPEANCEINRVEMIVSDPTAANYEALAAKVAEVEEQVDDSKQEHEQIQEEQGLIQSFKQGLGPTKNNGVYANSVLYHVKDNEINKGDGGKDALDARLELTVADSKLVESEFEAGHSENLARQKSRSRTVEEDNGSSCSSSGFGASVSSSSSDGANSIGDTVTLMADNKHDTEERYRRPNSLVASKPVHSINDGHHQPDCNPIYDSICQSSRGRNRNQPSAPLTADKFSGYKQLVGPDQAYPTGRLQLVENHNYALLNGCHLSQLDTTSIVPYHDLDGVSKEYANLPLGNNKLSADYAVVHCPTTDDVDGERKKQYNNLASDSSSARSYSTASANSGGFSTLAPARLECPLPTNNLESFDSLTGGSSLKKSSLLRKFGSLVSRAFAVGVPGGITSSVQSESKISEQDDQLEKQIGNNADGVEQRAALVIERNPHDELAVASCPGQADLVIVQTKHVNQRKQPPAPLPGMQAEKQNSALRRHDDRLSRGKKHSRKMKKSDSVSVVDSESSISCSSYSSLDMRRHRSGHPKKADSLLFEDLESLVSPSEDSSHHRAGENIPNCTNATMSKASIRYRHRQHILTGRQISIDCVSPDGKLVDSDEKVATNKNTSSSTANKSAYPRSLFRLFNPISSHKSAESTPNLVNLTETRYSSSQYDIGEKENSHQPISGFWGFSSLIGPTHATQTEAASMVKSRAKQHLRKSNRPDVQLSLDYGDHDSLVYTNLQSLNLGYKLHLSAQDKKDQQQQQSLDKHQSISLYQNLLQTYAKRRHRNHHGHSSGHHHHHHHHHHHRKTHHSLRHAHRSSTRCAQGCGQSCRVSSSDSESTVNSRPVVWGQLIKINKSDGSQVVELQRSPGKSWGFFVARGSINKTKGVFISRMHDNVTSSSLAGLLSIGDRILAIDECSIEPDYDILRVNQMISKKSKILLKVQPLNS